MVFVEEVATTINSTDIVAVMDGSKTFFVTAISSDPSGGNITWTILSPNEDFFHYIYGEGLTPATKQTVTLHLADGEDASTGAVVDNYLKTVTTSVCTRKKKLF